jgi:O-antigen/teichoic acid export membrane protein
LHAGDTEYNSKMSAPRILAEEVTLWWEPRQTRTFSHHFTTTVAAQTLNLACGVLTGVLAARLLGPKGRGELAAIVLWPTTLTFFVGMGINQAIVFYMGKRRFTLSELWTTSTVIGLGQSALAVLAGLAIIPFALRHYPHDVYSLALAVLFSSPFVIWGGYPGNLLQGQLDLTSFNLIQLAAPVAYAVSLTALAILHGVNLRDVVVWRVASCVVAFFFGYFLLLKRADLRISWNAAACLDMLKFGGKTQLGNISNYVNRSVDQLLLSVLVPPRDLGLYVVAVTVSLALNFVPQAAGIVTLAAGSNADAAGAVVVIGRSFRLSLLCLSGGCAVLFVAAPILITRVFGAAYLGSVLPCRILLPGAVAVGLSQVLYDGARALGDPALASYSEGWAVFVTVICLCIFLPWFGFVGAAIASTVAYLSSLGVTLTLYRLRFGVRPTQLLFLTRAG